MTVNDDSFTNWKNREEIAESMIPIIGKLHRERDITVLLHSRSLVNKSVVSILKTHRFARQIAGEELSVTETLPFLQALTTLDLGPSQIDIALLAETYRTDDRGLSVEEFTAEAVAGATGADKIERREPRDVVLYGFGRIGRLVARLLIEKAGSGNGLRLRAIVVRQGGEQDIVKRASLLRRDSIHGQFQGTITVDEANSTIIANGNEIKVIYANDPSEVDYTAYGIKAAILIDNTGKWRDREGLSKHLRPGIDKVVLTAPGKGDVPNVVHGVNHETIKPDEQILSCASCTTNAIVPPLKAMADEYGVLRGHVETVHSFTNDQNLLDNYHKADRRGRSAPLNMVITETGAASAVAKALPDLDAPITGSSIRVPVPDVSIAILSLRLGRETTREEVLDYLRNVSLTSPLKRQIDFTTRPRRGLQRLHRLAPRLDRRRRRHQGRRRQRDPLPLVRQRVRLLLPGHPRRPVRLRCGVPDLPGPGGLIPPDSPTRCPTGAPTGRTPVGQQPIPPGSGCSPTAPPTRPGHAAPATGNRQPATGVSLTHPSPTDRPQVATPPLAQAPTSYSWAHCEDHLLSALATPRPQAQQHTPRHSILPPTTCLRAGVWSGVVLGQDHPTRGSSNSRWRPPGRHRSLACGRVCARAG